MLGFEDRTRAILFALWREGNVAAAARAVGLDASNARRHLRTAERRAGVRLVEARRGGRGGRNARLTGAGRAWLRLGALSGVVGEYDEAEGVTPVRVGRRVLHVAGRRPPGPAEVRVPAAAVALERPGARGEGSPRNRIPMRVDRIVAEGEGTFRVALVAGALRLESLVVRGAVRDLRLRRGSRVVAIVKAVAIEVAPLPAG